MIIQARTDVSGRHLTFHLSLVNFHDSAPSTLSVTMYDTFANQAHKFLAFRRSNDWLLRKIQIKFTIKLTFTLLLCLPCLPIMIVHLPLCGRRRVLRLYSVYGVINVFYFIFALNSLSLNKCFFFTFFLFLSF